MKRRPPSGLALIVVVGVLGVLSVLAVAFVTMAQLERKASQQRVNAERAYLLARSGIEDALARLAMGQDPQAARNRYGGEDWDGDGALSVFEAANEVYRPGALDVDGCPVRYALRPSFFADDGTGKPKYRPVDGRQRGYTGALSGDRAPEGNQYALKISGGGFYVNGGDPASLTIPGGGSDPAVSSDYNTVLRRILGTLADALAHEPGGSPVSRADGLALIDSRPKPGWRSFNQIRDLALGGNQAKLDALRPYLALSAWVDTKVIAPNASAAMAGPYASWGDIKLARPVNANAPVPHSHAPDLERIPRNPAGGRIVGRSPVDLAWARKSRPALIALTANLQGLYMDGNAAFASGKFTIGNLVPATVTLDWTQPTDDCRTAVSALMTWTTPIGTWQQFNDFCDSLPMTGTADEAQAKRDILKANFNPNSDLNKFNPNPSLWKTVDKSDLLAYSTEFSLLPGGGGRLSAMGRILDARGRLLAGRTLGMAMGGGSSILRLSTQRDFVQGRSLGDPTFISRNKALPGEQTWGQDLLPGDYSTGVSLQSYPEPYTSTGGGPPTLQNPADYDGSLQLATLETPKDEYYQSPSPLPATHVMLMLARFDDTLDLVIPTAAPANANQTDTLQVKPTQMGTGLLQETAAGSKVINTLYPDGSYSESGRVPAYLDKDLAPYHGTLSFWVKAGYKFPNTAIPVFERSYIVRDNWRPTGGPLGTLISFDLSDYMTSAGLRHYVAGFSSKKLQTIAEIYADLHELPTPDDTLTRSHRWTLITFGWDTRAPTSNLRLGELYVDDGMNPDDYAYFPFVTTASNTPGVAADVTTDDDWGPHKLALGVRGDGFGGSAPAIVYPDATFDELALYDFGGAASSPWSVPIDSQRGAGDLASRRYERGRYYRESYYAGLNPPPPPAPQNKAAEWFSAPINLGPGAVIQSLSWTQIVPRGLKTPLTDAEITSGKQDGWDGNANTIPGAGGLTDGQIVFDLVDATDPAVTTTYLPGTVNMLFTNDAGSLVNRAAAAPFRLHAVFLPNVSLAEPTPSTPVLDPLTLDDITLVYQGSGGPRVSSWQEGE